MYVFIEELAVARMAELQREMAMSRLTSAWFSKGLAILVVRLGRIVGLPFARQAQRRFNRIVEVVDEQG